MDVEDRVAQAMKQLERNVEKAARNPEAVLHGSFSATSRNVTVWVDALGRTERYRITPNSVAEGDELQLIEAFNTATKEARRKAENLEFDGEPAAHHDQAVSRRPPRRGAPDWDDTDEGHTSWLQ